MHQAFGKIAAAALLACCLAGGPARAQRPDGTVSPEFGPNHQVTFRIVAPRRPSCCWTRA